MTWFSTHNHSYFSNFRLRDSVNMPEKIIDEAIKKNLSGLVLSDHETLAGTLKFYEYYEKLKKENKLPDGFKIGIGNEIYLVDKEVKEMMDNNMKVKFNHFLLLAKNQKGFEFLKKQTSKAWENSRVFRGMERTPTYKDELEEMMKEYKGDIIASTACVGGELPQLLLELNEAVEEKLDETQIRRKIDHFIKNMINIFGKDDFYIELQPSYQSDQLIANEWLRKISKAYGLKCIVTTDAHYLNKEQAEFHKQYLTAQEGEREVESFYSTTYIFSTEELREYFTDEDFLQEMIKNTNEIKDKIEHINFKQDVKIPIAHIPKFELSKNHIKKINLDKYKNINIMLKSDQEIDRYYIHLCIEGMIEKNEEFNELNLSRIDLEFGEVIAISKHMKQSMSSYFVLMKELVDIMWEVSLVGIGRGSAACYYTNFLLDIVQINPLKYDLPHWRFLTASRPELPDIDVDAQSSARKEILAKVKEVYGSENILNIGTYTTEGPRSATLTACRSMGIDVETATNITNMLPNDKGTPWPLKDAFFGNEEKSRKASNDLINEVEKHEGLKDLMLQSQGLIRGRGQHASGVLVFPNGYVAQNAMMKTTSGLEITQFDAEDTISMGGLKYDFLSINALDRIRTAMDLLLKEGKIEWQGSLKKTYLKYFHPDVLEMENPEMFKLLFDGEIISAFQFETVTGRQTLEKVDAQNFDELAAANSLMRLTNDGEQLVDRFVRYKKDGSEWEKDMDEYALTKEERLVLHELLDNRYGVCETQESLMLLSMHKNISGFDLREANFLRKSVAKKDPKKQAEQREVFFRKGREIGTRDEMLNYVWNECLVPQFGYAFSGPHIASYTLILMVEMNIAYRYGSIFWKTACLTVDSGIMGELEKGTNYGATAKSLESFRSEITPPSLSRSDIGFVPDVENGKIIYGLKPISEINMTLAKEIIDNRPYSSIDDFYEKNVENGMLTDKKMVVLIKSGLFDEINKDRKKVMIDFVAKVNPPKQKLTTANIPKLLNKIPESLKEEKEIYDFNKKVKVLKKHDELMDEYFKKYRNEAKKLVTKKYPQESYFDQEGNFIIEAKVFEKLYKNKVEKLTEWLQTDEAKVIEASFRRNEYWMENCVGSLAKWEMESISFYINDHELKEYDLAQLFNISDFSQMPEEPEIIGWKSGRGGKKYRILKSHVISGTVVDKIPEKGIAIIISEFGVVQVRVGKQKFQHYHKKIMEGEGKNRKCIDDSWFKKGTKLVFVGYRNGNDFMCNNNNSPYQHSVMLIAGKNKDGVLIRSEKREEA